jgi:hypothetical protein
MPFRRHRPPADIELHDLVTSEIGYCGRLTATIATETCAGRVLGTVRAVTRDLNAGARFSRGELMLAVIAAVIVALVMHWPLPMQMGSVVERDVGDPLVQAWQVAWGGHALAAQPLDFFQANHFHPMPDSLAVSDALIGYAPTGLVGDGVDAAVWRYNALFLFAYALAAFGAYLLGRELGLCPAGAALAGVAFAYAPWRLQQDGHLHVLSSGGIPLALFLLLRGYRLDRWGLVLAGWAVAAWQLSLGFTLGLQLGYLLLALGIGAVAWWWRRGRPAIAGRRVAAATVAGVLILGATGIVLARPYLRVLDNHPEAQRGADRVAGLSGPVWQFAAAPDENLVWGEVTSGARDRLSSGAEQTLFPGLLILGLAVAGTFAGPLPRRLRFGLAAAVVGVAVLSLGFRLDGLGRFMPYRLLYELAPGWQGVRVPARLNTLTSLGLALLAGGGAQATMRVVRDRWAGGRRHVGAAVAASLVVLVCIEGSGFELMPRDGGLITGPSHPRVPAEPVAQRNLPAPQMHLPPTIAANRRYVLWSTEGFPSIVNGRGSFDPAFFDRLAIDVAGFPDRRSVDALRALGVRTVVFHPDLAAGTRWAIVAGRPLPDGLGLTRAARGELVVYDLGLGQPPSE